MKNKASWPFIIAALYGLIIIALIMPVTKLCFSFGAKDVIKISEMFKWWFYWAWAILMLVTPAILLIVPVRTAHKRPITKKTILLPVIFSSLMMALLVIGLFLAIAETIRGEDAITLTGRISLIALMLGWGLWLAIFFRWSRKLKPLNLIEEQCRYLFAGSVLELLVAVPTHVIARHKNYCCAGFLTFFGICLGLSVMLISAGPGIYFLFAERWKKLHPTRK
jgi:hypothetical protein